ncbi:hypothetical protein N8T08_008156 [Aspergillus melleus]|uniref:Uncharacterized protein n=1 Tax=Aspergillus melleus TaxID=138277 RepID=A0ACC3AW58_9EURO|nr:hypothetical protein N8T08_008156 [Aspergillus melleus]
MSSTQRALLIAAPFEGLNGTLYDAESILRVLESKGFNTDTCFGENATRSGIFAAWERLISETKEDDAVVLYYSGHGGLVQSPQGDRSVESNDVAPPSTPWRYQFLVPVDYDQSTESDFRGILDVEISHVLRQLTERTRNVTVILDCCHSGRMFRAPMLEGQARQKSLKDVQFHQVAQHITAMQGQGQLEGQGFLTGNPHAVRVVATAPSESAWEYMNPRGEWCGTYTEALVKVIEDCWGHEMSWKTIFLRVRQLVNNRFPGQHPQVEGPETRVPFSLRQAPSCVLQIKIVNGQPIIQGGSVLGVRTGNTYTIVPLSMNDQQVSGDDLPEATVTNVAAFKAKVKLSSMPSWLSLSSVGALAVLKRESIDKHPIQVPESLSFLRDHVEESTLLRCHTADESEPPLMEFREQDESFALFNQQGVELGSSPLNEEESSRRGKNLIVTAERLVRAQRVLSLTCEKPVDKLDHMLYHEIGVVEDEQPTRSSQVGGEDYHVLEKESVYIKLHNRGRETVYVSVFDINVAGEVSFITQTNPEGIELPEERSTVLGSDDFGELMGLEITWPKDVSKKLPIDEQFLLIITNTPMDVRYLADSVNIEHATGRDAARAISTAKIQYDVVHLKFKLHPAGQKDEVDKMNEAQQEHGFPSSCITCSEEPIRAANILDVEHVPGWNELPFSPPTTMAKGLLGAIVRTAQRIPPCVWVINKHSEEITVTISKYRPNRLLTGVGLNASATGAGLDFSSSTWVGPATKKTLAPQACGKGQCMAVFPLWTRKEGFGVISVFRGPQKELFIENDRVPLGATVYFNGEADFDIVEYGQATTGQHNSRISLTV